MATEQTANGVVVPEAAGAETTSSVVQDLVQDPTVQGAAPLTTPDTSMEASAAVEGAAVELDAAQTEAPAPDPLPEPYTSLFKQAKEAPTEFNTWTSLISAAEKLGDIGRIRPVYDAFLVEYPLCYGYWKKYADAEAKYVSLQEASLVYDRGVAAVPYSVDLWGHYALHKQKAAAPVEEVERLFERGLAYVGMDYLSHGLWDKYLAYELSLGAHATVAQLYLRLLRMPIQRLDEYRTRFHEYASQHSTAELISEQERQGLAATVAQTQREEQEKLQQEKAALTQKLQEEQAAQAAQAAAAAQAGETTAAEQNAATAAQAAGNTDAAQAMDTTAAGDDVVDAVGQETVAAAGHMVSDITAPAAVTTADSTAVDDAPPADAGPDAAAPASQPPSVLAVPTPDDIAATVMADSAAAQSAAAVPTATAPSTTPPAVDSVLPVSDSPTGSVLAPPQDMQSQQTAADTDMPQATIPQSDGAGDDDDDLMQDAAPLEAAPAQLQAPDASADPSPAASLASVTTGYTGAGAEAMPAAVAEAAAVASDADGQASAVGAQQQQAVAQTTAVDGQQAEEPAAAASSEAAVAEELIKAAWLASVDEVWTSTKEEWQRRKPFEDAIKRPYFHVKPLDTAQLQNWSRYLDYIEEKKDIGMIIRLYERCLVACASYPDLWMRYVRWQEGSSKAAAQVALERATSVHCKRRPEIQLFAAHFHERNGNTDMARALFKLVTDRLSPTLISGAVQHANFERRQSNKAGACSVYDKFLEHAGVKGTATYAFVVIQYINALHWGFNDVTTAREVYNAALKKAADSLTLWEGIIHFEENLPGAKRVTHVLDIYDRAVAPAQVDSAMPNVVAAAADASATSDTKQDVPAAASDAPAEAAAAQGLTDSERELLSLRAIDFADLHGDATLWSTVERQHAQRFKLPGKVATSAAASRKRSASEAADASANKAAKTAAAATPAAAAAYAGATALPGPPAAGGGAQASAAMSGYYSSAAPYYQYPQGYPAAQQPYAYPAASAAAAPAYQYQGYYG